jgi:purine-binding chemotaxis protein CheW
MELVEFELASGRYALPMERVVELAPMVLARDLPGAPPNVCGLVNHRGSAIALVPLRRVFALEGETRAERTDGRGPVDDHLVIAEGRTRRYALQVDRVTGLRTIDGAALEAGLPSRHVRGVVVLEGELVVVQDLDALLSFEDEATLERAVAAQARAAT